MHFIAFLICVSLTFGVNVFHVWPTNPELQHAKTQVVVGHFGLAD